MNELLTADMPTSANKQTAAQRAQSHHETHKVGVAPGSLVHVGEIKVVKPSIKLFDYDDANLNEVSFPSIEESRAYTRQNKFWWLNVHGLQNTDIMAEIGGRFGLHPLVLEDIVNTQQRPKLEDYGHYLFVVLKAFAYKPDEHDCSPEQISLVLGPDFVLSFQERPTGVFDPIRERLRQSGGLLRKGGPDILLHALIDAVVDRYFVVTHALSEDIETLEESLIASTPHNAIESINHLKHEMLELRRSIWPTREVLSGLLRTSGDLIRPETGPYFRDIYDHCVHVIEQLDSLRELISDLLDIHLSNVSFRLNAEVRLLTMVTTMLAPATLITGFFGMNFHQMPWLERTDGWELAIIAILLAGIALLGVLLWRNRLARAVK